MNESTEIKMTLKQTQSPGVVEFAICGIPELGEVFLCSNADAANYLYSMSQDGRLYPYQLAVSDITWHGIVFEVIVWGSECE